MISDDVWARLDHRAGVATRSEARRLRAAFGTLAATVLLVLGLSVSGLAVPRLTLDATDPFTSVLTDDAGRVRHMSVRLRHTVVNDGWFPVTVTGVGLRGDGVRLATVQGRAFPLTVGSGERISMTLGSGERISMTLGLEIVDCDRAEATVPELVFRVERWWGSRSTAASDEDGFYSEFGWQPVLRSPCDREP